MFRQGRRLNGGRSTTVRLIHFAPVHSAGSY